MTGILWYNMYLYFHWFSTSCGKGKYITLMCFTKEHDNITIGKISIIGLVVQLELVFENCENERDCLFWSHLGFQPKFLPRAPSYLWILIDNFFFG